MDDECGFNAPRTLALAIIVQCKRDIEELRRKEMNACTIHRQDKHRAYTAARWLQCQETRELIEELNESMPGVIDEWLNYADDVGATTHERISRSQLAFPIRLD